MAIIKKFLKKAKNAKNVEEDLEKLEPLNFAAGNVKWCRHCGGEFGMSSKT